LRHLCTRSCLQMGMLGSEALVLKLYPQRPVNIPAPSA
jgi:hypothetical protein